jgi:hypothetical protein
MCLNIVAMYKKKGSSRQDGWSGLCSVIFWCKWGETDFASDCISLNQTKIWSQILGSIAWEDYLRGKVIWSGNLFVWEGYLVGKEGGLFWSGKLFGREDCLVRKVIWVEVICVGSLFAWEDCLVGKVICVEVICVGRLFAWEVGGLIIWSGKLFGREDYLVRKMICVEVICVGRLFV